MNALNDKLAAIAELKSGIKRLTLTEFRNYESLRLETEISPVIITGENGVGKTNILEAISFLTPGRGLRGARLADIKRIIPNNEDTGIPHSESWYVAAEILKSNEEYFIGTALQHNSHEDADDDTRSIDRRIVKINQQKITQQSELGKYVSAIWITPQMDRLFLGGTQPRRNFLDRLVYAFDLEHAKRTANFEHLYRQWYQLLKTGTKDEHWLSTLENEMSTIGVAIAAARREQIARLNTFIEHDPDDVFPDVHLELDGTIEKMLETNPAIAVEDFYAANLAKQRRRVLYNEYIDGVNHSDFKVFYKKKNISADLCSTGEQKALLVSIILAQTKCQMLAKNFAPILLLDEVTTHLDNFKRDALLEKICDLHLQAFITSTEAGNFNCIKEKAQFINLCGDKSL